MKELTFASWFALWKLGFGFGTVAFGFLCGVFWLSYIGYLGLRVCWIRTRRLSLRRRHAESEGAMSPLRISAVIPNYNHARFLPRCLDALLNQPVQAYEIIVVDDASTDNSLEVLESYARRHPRLKVVRNEKNQGVSRTLQRGLELSEGDYVCFPAADDFVLPGLFMHLGPMLECNPQAGAACGRVEWRCQSTGLKWIAGHRMPNDPCYLSPNAIIHLAHTCRYVTGGQHMIYRRKALMEVSKNWDGLKCFIDTYLGLVIGLRYGVCYTPKVLSVFNLFSNSYYNRARVSFRQRAMRCLLDLLASPDHADILPSIRESGLLGSFGPSMAWLTIRHKQYRQYINRSFIFHAIRRTAEIVARRALPNVAARIVLKCQGMETKT